SAKEKLFHQRTEGDREGRGEISVGRVGEELIEGRLLRQRQKSSQKIEAEHQDSQTYEIESAEPGPIPANRLPERSVVFALQQQNHIKRHRHVSQQFGEQSQPRLLRHLDPTLMGIGKAARSQHNCKLQNKKREQSEAGNLQDVPAAPDGVFVRLENGRHGCVRYGKRIDEHRQRWLWLAIQGRRIE